MTSKQFCKTFCQSWFYSREAGFQFSLRFCYFSNIFLHLGSCTVRSSSYKHTNTCPKSCSQSMALQQPLPLPHSPTHGLGLVGAPSTLLSILPSAGFLPRTTLRCPFLSRSLQGQPGAGMAAEGSQSVDGQQQLDTLKQTEIRPHDAKSWGGGGQVVGERKLISVQELLC